MKLRPYQLEAADKIKSRWLAGVNRQLVKKATGLGKTALFAALPDQLDFKGRMLVLVHREELAEQAADKLKRWNPGRTVGVEMGDRRSDGEQLVVASVQTVGRRGSQRLTQFDPADFSAVVCDEAHHSTASSYGTIFEHFNVQNNPTILSLGVTATVNRADGKGLGDIYQEIVYDMGILDGIKQGWLADLRGIRVGTTLDLDGVATRAGDFAVDQLSGAIDTPARNDLVARAWLDHGDNRQTVVFSVDVQHARNLCDAFKNYGVASEAIWGDDPYRQEKLKAHRDGHLKVLVNCQILTEGYDDWRIGCIVLARPTKSETLYTQIVGRGTRIPDGISNLIEAQEKGQHIDKSDCILIDVVDASSRHSLISLPTLFGMNKDMDLRGKTITKVMEEIEEVKRNKPLVDVSKVKDINTLKTYAEQVDLFKVALAPEVIQLSTLQWHKTGDTAYVLLLPGKDSVSIVTDILGKWHVIGTVNGYALKEKYDRFEDAIRDADRKVNLLGGRTLTSTVNRLAKWRNDPPTPAQLSLCRRLGIVVPPDATKGEVSDKMSQVMAERKKGRVA